MEMGIVWGDDPEDEDTLAVTDRILGATEGAALVADWQCPSSIEGIDQFNPRPPYLQDDISGVIDDVALVWRMLRSDIEVYHSGQVFYSSVGSSAEHLHALL
ncbi:hypothetical protein IAQ61_010027 [Plenodomus lingam]|nr:hypothetical protein IAQ61_010027 [Plenodomus lingam]